jgi:transposase
MQQARYSGQTGIRFVARNRLQGTKLKMLRQRRRVKASMVILQNWLWGKVGWRTCRLRYCEHHLHDAVPSHAEVAIFERRMQLNYQDQNNASARVCWVFTIDTKWR